MNAYSILHVKLLLLWWTLWLGTGYAFAPAPMRPHALLRPLSMSTGDSADTDDAIETSSTQYLLDKLQRVLNYFNTQPDKLPCGLECTPQEQELVSSMIADLLALDDDDNIVQAKNGKLRAKDILGTWDLLFTNSRIMTSNKSLSGLGYTASSMSQFGSLTQTLKGSQFLGFVEFVERFQNPSQVGETTDDDSVFDVTISGEWQLEYKYTDPFTGAPATALRIDPEKVVYGPSVNDADTWASLGPIKLLNIVYLSKNLQIARGNANPDILFVYKKRE